jgi:class 3 adenylate cyclase
MSEMQSPQATPIPSVGCEMETGILFMDLVDSSVFASVLGLREYADHLAAFHQICLRQCRHFFDGFLEAKYVDGRDFSARIIGDELLVYVHTGRSHNDVYLLACLAATLKAAWLAAPMNQVRIARKQSASQISGGIHHGPVWANPVGNGFDFCGYAINMAKRIEGHSRMGDRYRILLSDHAFKQVHFRQRNLIFGKCLSFDSKGLLGKTSAYEIHSAFMNLGPRLDPELAGEVKSLLARIVDLTTQDPWMHDFHQVWSEADGGNITDPAMELCRAVLLHDPTDPIALYHLAQALRERGDPFAARNILRELTAAWPRFGDGHWELARLLLSMGEDAESSEALRVARLLGIEDPLAGAAPLPCDLI